MALRSGWTTLEMNCTRACAVSIGTWGGLAEDVLDVRAYQRDLEKRMDDIEPKTT
jgi:hypothetical protein